MKKKKLMSLLLATMTCVSLIGCGNSADVPDEETTDEASESTTESAGGTVTLRVWAEESNWDNLNKMFDTFKQKYAGQAEFDIKLEQMSDGETKNFALSDIYAAADVFSIADDQLNSLVSAGAVAPVANPEQIKEANIEGAVSASTINDVMYAYPMTADNGYFLYYDSNYFTEEDVKTMDGILAVAEANGKKFGMDWTSGWYLYSFFGNTGLEFGINDDGVTNHCNWNSTSGSIKGVDIAQALLDISASPGFVNTGTTSFIDGVKDGSIIAGVSGVWDEVEIRNAWGSNYGAVKLPTYTCAGQQVQMSSFKGYKMMCVNYYSENKEWALKLADWLTNEENQTLRFNERSQGPANKNAGSTDKVSKIPAIKAVIAQSEYGVLQRVGNNYWGPLTDFGNTISQGNPKGLELQEIMDIMVEGVTSSAVQ